MIITIMIKSISSCQSCQKSRLKKFNQGTSTQSCQGEQVGITPIDIATKEGYLPPPPSMAYHPSSLLSSLKRTLPASTNEEEPPNASKEDSLLALLKKDPLNHHNRHPYHGRNISLLLKTSDSQEEKTLIHIKDCFPPLFFQRKTPEPHQQRPPHLWRKTNLPLKKKKQ